jgi:phosphoglycolate phosphatase-like HAD superfamily hydrolase
MRPTVLLFDVDGTLVTTGGAGRLAFERTFDVEYGRPDACAHFRFDGMTDRAIARLGLSAIGVAATEEAIDGMLGRYLIHLASTVGEAEAARYRVHAGMVEALEAAHAARMAVGLGTGNIREGARLKLDRVQLSSYFHFGGYGDDHESRPELIRSGARRGAERLGVTVTEARVVVIGDTPKDVEAARAIGAESLAVGTGAFSAAQLREAGATWAFETLAAVGALETLLGTSGEP